MEGESSLNLTVSEFTLFLFCPQMPEEQSFGVLVQVMHKYGLRDMFK